METIRKLYEHLHWANQSILESLQNEKFENELRLFSHILHAEQVWLTRLQGMDSSQLPIWAEADLVTCTALVKQNEEKFTAFFEGLTNEELDHTITYKNSKGTEFKTSHRDILIHVALHGQYHRGQVNSLLRKDGSEPVNVDYITFIRDKGE